MRKPSLRITVTVHPDGTIIVLFEWICSNFLAAEATSWPLPSAGDNCGAEDMCMQAVIPCTTKG